MQVKLRSDNEPVIKKIVAKIAGALREGKAPGAEGLKIQFEEVPRYSSQSLGTMGAFQKLLRGDVLTLRYQTEASYGITLHTSHNLWPWLVRWCSFIRSRFSVKGNQRTAYQDAFDTAYTSQLVPFGETVLFKIPMSKARRSHNRAVVPKGETAWRQGIFLGRSVTSNEYLLGTEDGTVTARSVRRLADSSRRYNRELMEKMIGVPWDMGTTIGRPKRKAEIALPQTPNLIPTEETAKKSPRLEPSGEVIQEEDEGDFPVQSGPSSASRPTADVGGDEAAPMDLGMSARRAWAGESGEMTPEAKRARVAGIFVGALYSPTEDTIVCEDDVDQAYEDSDNEESKPLSRQEMDEGDAEEFRKMDKYQTYDPVEQKDGMKILDAVWVRTRKPDGSVRCRYCVREFKRGDPRTDVFAVASSTSTSRVIDIVGIKMGYSFLTADAENAFWQVPIAEEAYMKPPKEWLKKMADSGVDLPDRVVWKLNTEWYGRRIAGQAFVEWAAGHLKEIDFKRNPAAPWMFYNPASGVLMEVHMDDFYATGPKAALLELEKKLHEKIKMKSQIHENSVGEKWTHLKRTREVMDGGIFLTPRGKYISDLLKMLGLEECNPAPTPYLCSEVKEGNKLSGESLRIYRAGVGIALYLSYDRTDVQFAVRELTKDMKEPTDGSLHKLHRLARYLQGTKDYGVWLPKDGEVEILKVHSDTDWANCKKTRKSCACAMFEVGGCLLFSYARSLQMLCLSSGEAEFNGGVAACSEGLFMKEVFAFIGFPLQMEVYLDSSAARGVFQRQGVGRIRHLEVKSLWVQDALHRKLFSLHAVPSQDNTADFGTKALAVKRFNELRLKLGIGLKEETAYEQESKKHVESINAIALSGFSKQALVMAMLTLLQSAEGVRTEEPNTEASKWGFDWIFTDLAVAFGILLVMQGTALWWCFRMVGRHLALSGGLSFKPARPESKDVAIQCERNTGRFSEVYILGRQGCVSFGLNMSARLQQRSRPYLQLRSCKCCPGLGMPSIPWAAAESLVKSR